MTTQTDDLELIIGNLQEKLIGIMLKQAWLNDLRKEALLTGYSIKGIFFCWTWQEK